MLNELLLEYNKTHPREEIDIIIFNTVVEKTLKINRSIRQTGASTILIADEGSGAIELVRMAVKMSNAQHYDLHSRVEDDWKQELKRIITTIGGESKHKACLHIRE